MARAPSGVPGFPPAFAYLISGTGGESKRMLRLLKAVYHPRNRYLLYMDAGSPEEERTALAVSVRLEKVFRAFRNVHMVGKGYAVDRTGPSSLAATLHGAAVLLKMGGDWDWFITLSSSDYPIVTQDGKLPPAGSPSSDRNLIAPRLAPSVLHFSGGHPEGELDRLILIRRKGFSVGSHSG